MKNHQNAGNSNVDLLTVFCTPIGANLCPMAGTASSAAKMPFPEATKASAVAFNSALVDFDKYPAVMMQSHKQMKDSSPSCYRIVVCFKLV